jgi:hypothetical protein
MREPKTDVPGLVLNGKHAYLAADLDRRYAHTNLPDQGNVLANLVRWAAGDRLGFELRGPGLVDCHVYRQGSRTIVHVVNLTNEGTWRGPIDELIPVGPLEVRLKGIRARTAEARVAGGRLPVTMRDGWAVVELKSVLDHEMLLLG